MKKINKGNTLLITVVFLTALCIFSAGITAYCVYSSKNSGNLDNVWTKKIQLKNELSSTFKRLISNEGFEGETNTIHENINLLDVDEEYAYRGDIFTYSFILKEESTSRDYLLTINEKSLKIIASLVYDVVYSLGEVQIL